MVLFYGNLYVFISYDTERIFPFDEIYMFLFHAETNAFLHRVTSYNRKSKILGKQEV